MSSFPMDERRRTHLAVTVEYDHRGGRATKEFPNPSAAKTFFVRMDRAGRNPRIVRATDR